MRQNAAIAFTFVCFWAGLLLPSLVLDVPIGKVHAMATTLLTMAVGAAVLWGLPKDSALRNTVSNSPKAWFAAVFVVSLAASSFTAIVAWAALRGA